MVPGRVSLPWRILALTPQRVLVSMFGDWLLIVGTFGRKQLGSSDSNPWLRNPLKLKGLPNPSLSRACLYASALPLGWSRASGI